MWNPFRRKTEKPRLFYSVDVHSHILPGVDDGSRSVDVSMELLERMRSWGISRVIATPHISESFPNDAARLDAAQAELNGALAAAGVDFAVERGAEYRIDDVLTDQLRQPETLSLLPGNHLLMENSFFQEAMGIDGLIFNLKLKGVKPILAHPERYPFYYDHRERLEAMHSRGTLFQVNLLSFAGYYGPMEQRMAQWLAEHDMVDLIATDLHNHRHADAIEAFLTTSRYRRLAERLRPANDTCFEQ